MMSLSINKSSVLRLKPQDSFLNWKTTRPGKEAVTIRIEKNKDKTDSGLQMVCAYAYKKVYGVKRGKVEANIEKINKRLDILLYNSRRAASIKEARQQIKKGVGIDDFKATSATIVPTYSVIKGKGKVALKRVLAHEIKNVNPVSPHLILINNEEVIKIREKEGAYKPKKIGTARINRLKEA